MRVYGPEECTEPGVGKGYPYEWRRCLGCRGSGCPRCENAGSIPSLVKQQAGYRCVRCRHPYPPGSDRTWSPCDRDCTHPGPFRAFSEYGDEFDLEHEAADALALLRCGDTCRVEALRRVLTVHHLNGVKRDCRWWNLTPLCQRCHLVVQARVVMDRPWPYEHSDWFKPYVAGYNAAAILGDELTRAEVVERLDELLELVDRQDRLPGIAA